ncbi:hypothetical protein LCGC14_1305680 [marine sediment metagenome]|uniref:Uncharacterized protein n=1 Tax=marine sediment metagenome TaxID=412755 RepID=A0A0F9N525_9ZZZZ
MAKAGRPKRVFSDEQVQEIKRMALLYCNTNTIAVALGIPYKTLERHFDKRLKTWRAEYRASLRDKQDNLSKTSADMCKFLGKNVLGQVEKQTLVTEQPVKEQTPDEQRASIAAATAFKREMARSDGPKRAQEAV